MTTITMSQTHTQILRNYAYDILRHYKVSARLILQRKKK